MNCPICGSDSKVLESATDCEAVYRKRRCVACGHNWYTEEYEIKSGDICRRYRNERGKELKKKRQSGGK